jgi:hypothetical protein
MNFSAQKCLPSIRRAPLYKYFLFINPVYQHSGGSVRRSTIIDYLLGLPISTAALMDFQLSPAASERASERLLFSPVRCVPESALWQE